MIALSASRIKTLEHCSWIYSSKYVRKLPDTTNKGALLGTLTHTILECLLNSRHKKHYDEILKMKTPLEHKGCERIIKKYLKKHNLEESDAPTVGEYLKIALNLDFFLEGYKLENPEYEFIIENENPKYKILGYIDKMGTREGIVKVVDYKTSKSKPSAKEQQFNIQGMMYVLAAKKLWPKTKKAFVNFLYLKFPRSPKLVFTCSDEQLKGFEQYLAYLQDYVENWNDAKAVSNLGYDDYEKRRLCGKKEGGVKEDGSPVWRCPFMLPFDYFALIDKDGKVVKTSKEEKDLTVKDGQTIKKMRYEGCPKFSEPDDDELF